MRFYSCLVSFAGGENRRAVARRPSACCRFVVPVVSLSIPFDLTAAECGYLAVGAVKRISLAQNPEGEFSVR